MKELPQIPDSDKKVTPLDQPHVKTKVEELQPLGQKLKSSDYKTLENDLDMIINKNKQNLLKNENQRIKNEKNSDDRDAISEDWEEEADENPPVLPADQYERTECPETVRTIINILITSSRFYRRAGKCNRNLFFIVIFSHYLLWKIELSDFILFLCNVGCAVCVCGLFFTFNR